MHTKILSLALLTVTSGFLYSQTVTHPWRAVDHGGGKSNGGSFSLHSSIGQTSTAMLSAPSNTLEAGYLPGIRWLTGVSSALSINMEIGWNLVSAPMLAQDYTKESLFPNATSFAFAFTVAGYQRRDTLQNGIGYWIKFSSVQNIEFAGTTIASDTIDVIAGWNIIGPFSYPSLSSDVAPIPPVAILSSFFAYTGGSGYAAEDTLEPGKGYWVKVNQAGKLMLGSGSVLAGKSAGPLAVLRTKNKQNESLSEDGVHKITLRDATGVERKLFYTTSRTDMKSTDFELPPPAPEGILDVRFSSQSQLVAALAGELNDFKINTASVVFPLEITWNGSPVEGEAYINIVTDTHESRRIKLNGQGSVTVNMNGFQSISLELQAATVDELPTSFALAQNYPNPFNPTTIIKYDLPVDSRVTLKIFNILGQVVRTLSDEVQLAGYKSVQWDSRNNFGNNVSTGVYFYRVDAVGTNGRSFNEVKKMLLLK